MVVSIDTACLNYISMGLVSVPPPQTNSRADWFHMIHLWGIDIPLLAGCKGGGITGLNNYTTLSWDDLC